MEITENCVAAQSDLALLVDYAVRRPPPDEVDDAELSQAISALQFDSGSLKLHQNAAQIYLSLDYFSRYLRPATLEGLRLASTAQSGQLRYRSELWTLLLLAFTLILQCYAAYGTAALSKIDKNAETILNIQQHVQAMKAISTSITEKKDTNDNSHDTNPVPFTLKEEELRGAEENQCYAFRSIYNFNAGWGKPLSILDQSYGIVEEFCPDANKRNVVDCTKHPKQCQIVYGTEFDARFTVKILDTIILPALYAILGAWVWVIRDRSIRRENKSLEEYDLRFRISRSVLSAALGSVLGFFYSTMIIGTPLSSIPLAGLGFIVGYNSELLFRWFDTIIGSVAKSQK